MHADLSIAPWPLCLLHLAALFICATATPSSSPHWLLTHCLDQLHLLPLSTFFRERALSVDTVIILPH